MAEAKKRSAKSWRRQRANKAMSAIGTKLTSNAGQPLCPLMTQTTHARHGVGYSHLAGGSAPSPPSMVERIKKNLTPEASWIIPTLFCRSNVEDGLIQIFQFWARSRLRGRHSSNDSADLERNSLRNRTGNYFTQQNREFWRRNRDFACENRNRRRMRFSVHTAARPERKRDRGVRSRETR